MRTGSGRGRLPIWARVGIGVPALGLFVLSVLTLGRSAVRRGITGDVDESLVEQAAPAAG